ncbi:2-hydroxychromene-2-carboxylate isomerase [Paracoccus suum]|uniref:2-hydroxychromene-2-carboxylate isomerase n=1 Tax=Paracoccus suum TaxID=2259340 RepID=A0A344PPN8_9RHOB|nr:2-hydroxychromene-2-carboxylate isomerase [Paracoccus suum]AXC51343.1 2-hydroxychromene-2-carboxylate isomerase [Paracoccus suum]
MQHLDYYFGTISPYAYLAGDRLERIAADRGAEITYKPLDIMQLFDRTGGVRPQVRHESRMAYRAQELARWAEHLGMPLNLKPAAGMVNAVPSSYAIIAAQAAGGGNLPMLVQSILRAHWAEDRDISSDTVLRELLQDAGFDPDLVESGLFIGAETCGRNLDEAVLAGVFGSPFYILRETDQRFWGQDRLEFLDRALANQ